MAQYNYPNRGRRVYAPRVSGSTRSTALSGLAHAMNNRVFVPDENSPIPAAPQGVYIPSQESVEQGTHWLPAGREAVDNPFFQGEQPEEFAVPTTPQYYGDGHGQTAMPMEEFLYQQQGKLEGQKALAEAQLQADEARARANENLMTGKMNPSNPLVAQGLQAMGIEVTPAMLGQKNPDPNLVIQNIYGPSVAAGNLPNKQQDMTIEARRTAFANNQSRVNQYITDNKDNLTEMDMVSLNKQLYDSFPEFAEGQNAPKTSQEILAEREEAKKQDFIKRTAPIAQQYGVPELPYKTSANGEIVVDATAMQAMMAAQNNQRQNLNAVSTQAFNMMTAKNREEDAKVPPKPSNEYAPGYSAWLEAYTAAQKAKAANAKEYRETITAVGASPDPRAAMEETVSAAGVAAPTVESGDVPNYDTASIQAANEKGLIQVDKPLYLNGVLGTFDSSGRFNALNR